MTALQRLLLKESEAMGWNLTVDVAHQEPPLRLVA
jgi:hypothetical protein